MNFFAKIFYEYRKFFKGLMRYLVLAGPGLIVMVADNDAGGITTYAVTGAQYKYHFLWFLIVLGFIAYFVQEMTVRLGAVTKRGHGRLSSRPSGLSGDGFLYWIWF